MGHFVTLEPPKQELHITFGNGTRAKAEAQEDIDREILESDADSFTLE